MSLNGEEIFGLHCTRGATELRALQNEFYEKDRAKPLTNRPSIEFSIFYQCFIIKEQNEVTLEVKKDLYNLYSNLMSM